MSQVDTAHAWWSRLRHQGLLLSPVVMLERYPSAPEPATFSATAKLRDAQTRFNVKVAADGEPNLDEGSILAWVDALLDGYLGHKWGRIARQNAIPEKLTAVVRIGSRSETIRPHRVVYADANATVPALLVMADTSAQVGRGRGRTAYARFLELLRGTGHRLGLADQRLPVSPDLCGAGLRVMVRVGIRPLVRRRRGVGGTCRAAATAVAGFPQADQGGRLGAASCRRRVP